MHIQSLQAVLTAHGAAPVEFTLTLGHPGDAGGVISSAAAHDFTAVHASGSQVAHTACCTQRAWKTSQGGVIERVWVDYNMSQKEKQEVHPLGQGPRPTSTQPGAVTNPTLWVHAVHVLPLCSCRELAEARRTESTKDRHEILGFPLAT